MKKVLLQIIFLLLLAPSDSLALECSNQNSTPYDKGNYTLIIEGYDWGPAVKKVVLPMSEEVRATNSVDFQVTVKRSAKGVEMKPAEATGDRQVLFAYIYQTKREIEWKKAIMSVWFLWCTQTTR